MGGAIGGASTPEAARESPGSGISPGPRPLPRPGARRPLRAGGGGAGGWRERSPRAVRGSPAGGRPPLGAEGREAAAAGRCRGGGRAHGQRRRPCSVIPGDGLRGWRAQESRGDRRGRRRAGRGRPAAKSLSLSASPGSSPRPRLAAGSFPPPGSAGNLRLPRRGNAVGFIFSPEARSVVFPAARGQGTPVPSPPQTLGAPRRIFLVRSFL